MSDDRKSMHRLRGALNGVVLQLEVLALAAERGDPALLTKALAAARGAARDAVDQLEALAAERASEGLAEPGCPERSPGEGS